MSTNDNQIVTPFDPQLFETSVRIYTDRCAQFTNNFLPLLHIIRIETQEERPMVPIERGRGFPVQEVEHRSEVACGAAILFHQSPQ